MMVFTEDGFVLNVAVDFKDPAVLWARSQDRESVEDVIAVLQRWSMEGQADGLRLVEEPDWDYEFRVAVTREQWNDYLWHKADEMSAGKFKPAVAAARGREHPVSRCVEHVFYYLSENRPDGTKPAWLARMPKRKAKAGAR